jgi:ankyrin repeat protein
VEIDLPDKNNKTPLMLAIGRKHEKIVSYLKKETEKQSSIIPKFDIW